MAIVFMSSFANCFALDMTYIIEPSEKTLSYSTGIVEGIVTFVEGSDELQPDYCQNIIYKLKVLRSWTDKIVVGSTLTIGLNFKTIKVIEGQRQFAVLADFSKKIGSICDSIVAKVDTNNLYIPFSYASSVFAISNDIEDEEIFYSRACNKDNYFLFERDMPKHGYTIKSNSQCREISGKYSNLLSVFKSIKGDE